MKISRNKIELFLNCEKCFFLDVIHNIKRPPAFPYLLNSAVDKLLKNEFDYYRKNNLAHPYFVKNNLNLSLYENTKMEDWRKFNIGISHIHKKTGFLLRGSIDDIWVDNEKNELIIVEYKSTSKSSQINLNSDWQNSYKRQIEFYQYLFHKNNYKVSKKAFFVYCNGLNNEKKFNEKLKFDVKLLDYEGSFDWIEKTIDKIYKVLEKRILPNSSSNCNYCKYFEKIKYIDGS